MRRLLTLVKNSLHTVMLVIAVAVAAVYVAVRMHAVDNLTRDALVTQLADVLDTRIDVGDAHVGWLNQVALDDVVVYDQHDDTLLHARRIMVAYDFLPLVIERRLVVNTIQLVDFDLRATRPEAGAEPNYKFVLDALAPRQENRERLVIYNLDFNAILLRRGRVRYDVGTAAPLPTFDPNHIDIGDISAHLGLRIRQADGVYVHLRRLSMAERSGIEVHNCRTEAHIGPTRTSLGALKIDAGASSLEADTVALQNHPWRALARHREATATESMPGAEFLLAVRGLRLHFVPTDLNHLMADANQLNVPIDIDADIDGDTDAITLHRLDAHLKDELQVAATGWLSGLAMPLDSMTIHADVAQSYVTPRATRLALERIWHWQSPELTAVVDSMGTIAFDGSLDGRLSAIDVAGNVAADIGTMQATGTLRSQFARQTLDFDGRVAATGLRLSRLLAGTADLGSTSVEVGVTGNKAPDRPLRATLNGTAHIRTTHGTIDASGRLGVGDTYQCRLVADVTDLCPHSLRLLDDERMAGLTLSCHATSDIAMRTWDRANGTMHVDGICLSRAADTLRLSPISVDAHSQTNRYDVMIHSPMLDVRYESNRPMGHLTDAMTDVLRHHLGQTHDATRRDSTARYTLSGRLPANTDLTAMLHLPVDVARDITFDIGLDSERGKLYGEVSVPDASWDELRIASTLLTLDGEIGKSVRVVGNATLYDNDRTIRTAVDGNLTAGSVGALIDLDYVTGRNTMQTRLDCHSTVAPWHATIEPTDLQLNGQTFHTGRTSIDWDNDAQRLDIGNLRVEREGQRLAAGGTFSAAEGGDLHIQLTDFALDMAFDMLGKGYLSFGGRGTGDIHYTTDSVARFYAEGFQIDDFSYQDTVIGDAMLDIAYDLPHSTVTLSTDITTAPEHTSVIDGHVKLGEHDSLDITFHADTMPVGFLSYWVGGFLQGFSARATGDVHLYGEGHHLCIEGRPKLHQATFTHSLLGAPLTVDDTIALHTDSATGEGYIRLANATLTDRYGHSARLTADVRHTYIGDFDYDVDIDIPQSSQGFLLFDHPQATDRTYWGQIFANGACHIHGNDGHHRFNVGLQTADRSHFYLSPGQQDASQQNYSFITFRDRQQLLEEQLSRLDNPTVRHAPSPTEPSDIIEADLQISATERCQVDVQLDPLADDRLQCRGRGTLLLHYDSRRDLSVTGDYNIASGSYTVTMQGDLINKAFTLQDGSTISFAGDPSQADLNLHATYTIPSANLRDLDQNIALQTGMSRTTLPVACSLNATGTLATPVVTFGLQVLNAGDDVQALVHNIIGTQEMMNREVFYLLLFNKFYTPDYATASQGNTGSELTSLASATLTSQLNSLLGHASQRLSLATNLRTDRVDMSDIEGDLSLSTTLLGDRLTLGGTLGYRNPANRVGGAGAQQTFVGDFDIEYIITPSGTIRAKAYSHANERDYSINNALTTQGVGIVLRRDFNYLRSLFHRSQQKQ